MGIIPKFILNSGGTYMSGKTSSEIQDIFGLCRDDIKRLEKDGVLNPKKSGQGKASLFSERDLNTLLDIKIYLLAGYRISDMKNIITATYDSDSRISEQIHIYKKRIQMLEFIQTIRADIRKLYTLSQGQWRNVSRVHAEKTAIPAFGTQEFNDFFWKFMKLIFIIDFMSQKESFKQDSEIIVKRALAAYRIVVDILSMTGTEIRREGLIEGLNALRKEPIEDDREVKEFAKELVEEYLNQKDQIIDEIFKEGVDPIVAELDPESGATYRDMMLHIIGFALDYFVDERELYYLFMNFIQFVQGLDQEALDNGIVKIGEKNNG